MRHTRSPFETALPRPSGTRRRPAPAHRLLALAALLSLTAPTGALAQAPLLPAAVPCGSVGAAGVTQAGNRLFRVDVPTADYPAAVCNDGSPAVIYVAASPGGANADRWHIHLQGGGACRTPESCAQRWCSVDTSFGMDKMSSTLAPVNGAAGNGMFSHRADNPLRDFNHVFVHYCSSDGWLGRGDSVQVTAQIPGGSVDYTVHFQGASIIDAVLDMLRRPGGAPVSYFDGDAMRTLPDLDHAELVLLAGASAGGGGVASHLDRIAGELPTTNLRCAAGGCDDLVRGVIDAAYGPDRSELTWTESAQCAEQGLCTYDEVMAADWATGPVALWHAIADESCVDWHARNRPDEAWRCADLNVVVDHHLTTPHFLRFDLQDSLIGRNLAPVQTPTALQGVKWRGMWLHDKAFAMLMWEQMLAVRSNWQLAAEVPTRRGGPVRLPGVFAPQCNLHETLRNNPGFFGVTAPDADGVGRRMPELLMNWLDGIEPQVAIERPRGTGALPHCP